VAGDDVQHRPDLAGHFQRAARAVGGSDLDARQSTQNRRADRAPEPDLHFPGRAAPQALSCVLGDLPACPDNPEPVGSRLTSVVAAESFSSGI
jgi:hypothetical protein